MSQLFTNHEWFNFPAYFHKTYRVIDIDKDVPDVTLACDDGALDAHKLLLCATSLFFRRLLKNNKHDQPFILMKGLKMKQLLNLMDFIYHGQVSIDQDDVEEFIDAAIEFEIKGIHATRNNKKDVEVDQNEKLVSTTEKSDREEDVLVQQVVEVKEEDMNIDENDTLGETQRDAAEDREQVKEEVDSVTDSTYREITIQQNKYRIDNTINVDEIVEKNDDRDVSDIIEQSEINTTTEPLVVSIGDEEQMAEVKDEKNIMNFILDYNVYDNSPIMFRDEMKKSNSIIKLGMTFSNVEEVKDTIIKLSDTTFCKFVNSTNGGWKSRRRMIFKCTFGILRRSQSQGIRQTGSKYVGCPAFVEILQSTDRLFRVVRGNLEHENHEISEENYLKMKRSLTKDQEEAVKALLETEPTTAELAIFLNNITGKHYNKNDTRYIKIKFTRKKAPK